jgi:hypothetical protein
MSKCGLGAAVVAVRGPATVGSAKRRVVGCAIWPDPVTSRGLGGVGNAIRIGR